MIITLPWPDKRPSGRWTPEEERALASAWSAGFSREEIAAASGRTVGSIANKAMRIGASSPREWTDDEVARLSEVYGSATCSEEMRLRSLSEELGRSYNAVVVKAGRLGLSDIKRKGVVRRKDAPKYGTPEELSAALSRAAKERLAKNGHPRGMAGKKHSPETKAAISMAGRARAATEDPDVRAARTMRALKTKVARYGAINPAFARGSWKAGWREIGGKRNFYRSRWEANYARWLEWLKQRGEIRDWQHEPETFWFEAIKRGVRSYKPDFRVWENDGTSALHEVKGYMDARSKTTLKRMAKYHPDEKIIVIRERSYNEIARKAAPFIADWEHSGRSDRA